MKELVNSVKLLVEGELICANRKFPMFNSTHEGYSVIKEEVEEAEEDLVYINTKLRHIWYAVKDNDTERANKQANILKEYAIHLVAEAIQVAAMAQKFIDSEVK